MYPTLHRGINLATETWRGKGAGQVHTGRLEQSWDLTQISESPRGLQHPCPRFPPTGSWLSLGTSPPCPILIRWFERIQFQMSLDLIKPISLSHFPATMMCTRTSLWPLDIPGLVGELPEETFFCGVMWEEVRSRTIVAVLLQGEEALQLQGPLCGGWRWTWQLEGLTREPEMDQFLSESLLLALTHQAPVNLHFLFILCQFEALLLFWFAFLK